MRGKDKHKNAIWAKAGITPAYAGKSRKPVHRRKPVQDHPRLCGEKYSMNVLADYVGGSPPPMRGKEQLGDLSEFEDRITPAYAGKSLAGIVLAAFHKDHPRLCGEKLPISPT